MKLPLQLFKYERATEHTNMLVDAVNKNDLQTARYLLQTFNDIDIEFEDKNYMKLLAVAVSHNNPDLVKLLLDNGANIYYNVPIDDNCVIMMDIALRHNNPDLVKLLVDYGAIVDSYDGHLNNLGYYDINIVQSLINASDNLDQRNNMLDTPLINALADFYRPDIAKMLIDAGADFTLKDSLGRTVFDYDKSGELKQYVVDNFEKIMQIQENKERQRMMQKRYKYEQLWDEIQRIRSTSELEQEGGRSLKRRRGNMPSYRYHFANMSKADRKILADYWGVENNIHSLSTALESKINSL